MGNFANVTVTDAGRQLINNAIGGGQTVTVTNAAAGSGYPSPTQDPADFTALAQHVMDAQFTSANDQVLYQTTVRITISSGNAPFQFQLNELGVYAQIGTQPAILFAYASAAVDAAGVPQGDFITPDPGPSPVQYDYAILIEYEADSPVTATVTMQPVIELHAATHRGNGVDPIGLADTIASGLLMSPPNNPNKVLLGTVPQSFGPIPLHAPTHLDNGTDPIPTATTLRTGLLVKLSGNATDLFHGDASWGPPPPPIPTGVILDYAGATPPSAQWLICDGSAVSRTTYSALFAVLGTTFGSGDGVATFALPDLRGRVTVGAGAGTGLTSRTLGAIGGEEAHAITQAELAPHTHLLNDPGHAHSITDVQHYHAYVDNGHVHSITDPTHEHVLFPQSQQAAAHVAGPLGPLWIQWSSGPPAYSSFAATGITGTNNATIGISISSSYTGINTTQSHTTGITVASAGGSSGTVVPHNNMMPFAVLNKIIHT